jgi:hypothetical protein
MRRLGSLLTVSLVVAACNKAPSEPDAPARSTTEVATVAPLLYDVPGTWSPEQAPKTGPLKAHYQTEKTGNDKAGADVEVYFYGTGALGDPARVFKEWGEQFEPGADAGPATTLVPVRESFTTSSKGLFPVDTFEVAGTYKINLSPPVNVGAKKRSAMQMVKAGYRLYGAALHTKDRGTWFFKMIGPDESVQASRQQLRVLLDSAR